jgi:hypothetical protein
MLKIELFHLKRPKPFVLPSMVDIEKHLLVAVCKSYNRMQVLRLANIRADGKWLRAYKVQRKGKILLEGRIGERWCSVSFSHGMGKSAKAAVIRAVMKRHKSFKVPFQNKYVGKSLDEVKFVGAVWRSFTKKTRAGSFSVYLKKCLDEKKKVERENKARWRKRPLKI